jgi:hypothetical protein
MSSMRCPAHAHDSMTIGGLPRERVDVCSLILQARDLTQHADIEIDHRLPGLSRGGLFRTNWGLIRPR